MSYNGTNFCGEMINRSAYRNLCRFRLLPPPILAKRDVIDQVMYNVTSS